MEKLPRSLCRFASLVACVLLVCASAAAAQDDPQTGTFNTIFDERSPLSDLDAMAQVGRWERRQLPDWDIEDIEFQMVVPDDYTGEEAYGLLVFIHPYDDITGTQHSAFFFGRVIEDVLAQHKIIWVSFDDGGNQVLPNKRIGLALDAVHNATNRYNIDEDRIYVSGMSGGGRMTCMAGIYYPQVFSGAVPIVGSMYFRQVPVPQDPDLRALIRPEPGEYAVWPRTLWTPRRDVLRDMKQSQRWVLLTGSEDFNMPEMRMHFEHGFERDEFEHAHYLEVPDMAHAFPEAEWFEQAIELLDAPLNAPVDEDGNTVGRSPRERRQEQLAQRRLRAVRPLIERDPERALRLLGRIDELYHDTAAAQTARELIEQLEAQFQDDPAPVQDAQD